MRPGHRSVVTNLLLFLTVSGCAQRAERVVGSQAPASDPEPFHALGVDAPETERSRDAQAAPLDLERIAQAFAEAKTLTPQEVAAREAPAPGAGEAAGRTTISSDRPVASEQRVLDARTVHPEEEPRPPPPSPAPSGGDDELDLGRRPAKSLPAEEKKEVEREQKPEAKKSKDKADEAKAGRKAPKTVLPAVSRRRSSARIMIEDQNGARALTPRAVRVMVEIQGPRARTVVDYVFENPHDRRLEGTFFHPLPADASPAGFAMFDGTARVDGERFFRSHRMLPALDGKSGFDLESAAPRRSRGTIDWGPMKTARVVGQKRAREVYEDIVRKDVDPALLELGGGGDFEARVFPLEPRSLKRVVIAYEQTLPFDGRAFRYGFTVPSEKTIAERAAEVRVDTNHGQVVASPAGAEASRQGRWTRYSLPSVAPGHEILLGVAPPAPDVALRGRDPKGLPGDAFFAAVRPKVEAAGDRTTGRAILMVDTSLSSEEAGAYARRGALLRALLEKDSSIEQYAVMLFDVRPRWLHAIGWRDNTPENRRATAAELERVFLEGATSFEAALAELGRQREWAVEGAPTTVFLLSDGHITWGLDRVEALAARQPVLRDVRWVTYRFGEEPANRSLFDVLVSEGAEASRTVTLLSEAEVNDAALAHRRAPAELIGVEVKGNRAVDLVVAGDPRQLFPDQALLVGGRLLDEGEGTLVVRYRQNGREASVEVPLRATEDRMAPRAFAELHASRLIAADDPRLDRMVVALSQHYRLANARASFLILENDAQVEEYALQDEQADLNSLARLEAEEMEGRRRALLGLSLEGVPERSRALLELLRRRTDGLERLLLPQPLLDAPFAGGRTRAEEEVAYRKRRDEERMSYQPYQRIARIRALSGDTAGAVRALSSAVELRPRCGECMRLVGYALMALAQYDVAAELFERLRLLRTFEAQAYLEEALALDAVGRVDAAAERYEIILARTWARHDTEVKVAAAQHYARVLRSLLARAELAPEERRQIEARLGALEVPQVDYAVTTHWSTDSVDIDLWIYEPGGEKCWYQSRATKSGGELLWDTTDGLGPEIYRTATARDGGYDAMVHYYGSSAPRLAVPAALLVVMDRKGADRTFLMRMLPEKDVVLMLRTDVFP